jgi:putative membrane protein
MGMNDKQPNVNDLAVERNILAAERTLMAWIRTALSMISFGFAIYQFMQILLAQDNTSAIRPHEPRHVGLALISLGTFAVIIATIQHFRYVKRVRPDSIYKYWKDLSFIVACLLTLLGLLMLGSIILNMSLFG